MVRENDIATICGQSTMTTQVSYPHALCPLSSSAAIPLLHVPATHDIQQTTIRTIIQPWKRCCQEVTNKIRSVTFTGPGNKHDNVPKNRTMI